MLLSVHLVLPFFQINRKRIAVEYSSSAAPLIYSLPPMLAFFHFIESRKLALAINPQQCSSFQFCPKAETSSDSTHMSLFPEKTPIWCIPSSHSPMFVMKSFSFWTCGHSRGRRGGTSWESGTDVYTLPCVNRQLVGSCSSAQETQLSAPWQPRGVEWGVGGRLKREEIYVYL